MLFVLGVGSNIAMTSCVMTVIRDQFPNVKAWHAASGVTVVGLLIGLVYVTPVIWTWNSYKNCCCDRINFQGGQFILNLVDFFGASFTAFILAIAELVAFGWIYGKDISIIKRVWTVQNKWTRKNVFRSKSYMSRYYVHDWTKSWTILENLLGHCYTSIDDCNSAIHILDVWTFNIQRQPLSRFCLR